MTDYFQDILPPEDKRGHRAPADSAPDAQPQTQQSGGARSIRNVSLPSRRTTGVGMDVTRPPAAAPSPNHERDIVSPMNNMNNIHKKSGTPATAWWVWVALAAAVVVIAGIIFLLFRPTTVTLKPRVQDVILETVPSLTAYPAASNATGTLAYRVREFNVEESEPVAAHGTQHAERKASGSITVFNEYSTDPVRLVVNTRFATPDGLVFRAPAPIVIPGKSSGKPGSVSVTVVADAAGDQYNVTSTKFTLPGLKSSDMYGRVYATSNQGFTGGFLGDEPAVESSVLSAAQASMRHRIEQNIRATLAAATTTLVMPGLAQVSYTQLPVTTDQNGAQPEGTVILHERAHVTVPEFDATAVAMTVASAAGVDTANSDIALVPGENFAVRMVDATPVALGTDPISFAFAGHAQLLWHIDTVALSQALAGKDNAAFETIVRGFTGIEKARARIQPFWNTSFPSNPSSIHIVVDPAFDL